MNVKALSAPAYLRKRVLLLGLLICSVVVGAGAWHPVRPQQSDKVAVKDRIAVIMRETIQQGDGSTGDIKTWTKVPPSTEAVEEIRKFGDDAVPVLAEYFHSEDGREHYFAIEFLGLLGGSRIIKPLREVILYAASPGDRAMALRWITQAPWKEAEPIIREAAETDTDSRVRETAKDLLVSYAPK